MPDEAVHNGNTPSDARYLLEGVLRACAVLKAFQFEGETLRLHDIVRRTGLNKTIVFRLVRSLQEGGLLEDAGDHKYRARIKPVAPQSFRFGYAGQGEEFPFARAVNESIRVAASSHHIDLVDVDNHYSARTALRNASFLARQHIDLAIEFQTHESIAPQVSAAFLEHKIPLIAIDIPHPGATYFGADNYRAGLIGGRALGRWANRHWDGRADELILLELPIAGSVPNTRLQGIATGVQETLSHTASLRLVRLNGKGCFGPSLEAVRRHLRLGHSGRILVGAINDVSALGAVRALEEAGRWDDCAVMSQGASPEARAELRRKTTRLIGSVAFFPERYGSGVISLGLDILNHRPAPPAVFVEHQLITAENVDHFYPNDALITPAEMEILLLRAR